MCTPRDLTASDWEHRLEGLPVPLPGEVAAPAHLADGDEWAHAVICPGCGEIRQID